MREVLALCMLLSFGSVNPGCCASKAQRTVAPIEDEKENKRELDRIVQQHNNTVRRRAMTIPIARQVQHLRRSRHRTYLGDIPNEQGGLANQLARRMSEEGKERTAVAVDIKPTGLHVSFSLD